MATRAKLVSQALATVSGPMNITGAGFAPGLMLVMLQPLTASGGMADAMYAFGAAKSPSIRQNHCISSEDNQDLSDGGTATRNDDLLRLLDYDGGVRVQLELNSYNSDGAEIEVVTAPVGAWLLHALFIADDGAGSSLQSALGVINCNTSPGNQDVTGLGFDNPDFVIFHSGSAFSSGSGVDGSNSNVTSTFGFASDQGGTINQSCTFVRVQHGQTISNTKRGFRTNRCFQLESDSSTLVSASYVGGVTGGFRININTTSGTAWRMYYIAVKGVSAQVHNRVGSTGTGTTGNIVTGISFKPVATIALSVGEVSSDSAHDTMKLSLGMATGSANRACCSLVDLDAQATTNCSSHMSTAALIQDLSAGHGSPTVIDRFDINSFNTDGATLDHEIASGAGLDIGLLFIGPDSASPQTILPTGIASGQTFGTANIFTGSQAQTIQPSSIPSGQAFGTALVTTAGIIAPLSILSSGASDVVITGLFDEGAFDPQFTQYKVELINGPDPRSTFLAFGTIQHTFSKVLNGDYLARWMLSNADGSVTSQIQSVAIAVTNFGRATVVIGGGGGGPFIIQPASIPSSESFGTVLINQQITPTSIGSSEAFGTASVTTGGLGIIVVGIPSSEQFGDAIVINDLLIQPIGIPSGEVFGNILVEFEGAQLINVPGISSGEEFGTATISTPAPPIQWPPIEDIDTVWTRIPPGREG